MAAIDLFVEVADIDIHDVGEGVVMVSPDLFEKGHAAERFVGIGHQTGEEVEFLPGQRNRLGAAAHFASVSIQCEIGHLQQCGGLLVRGLAPEQRFDSGEEFFQGKGFAEVIVRSLAESAQFILQCVFGGEHQDQSLDLFTTQDLADLVTVYAGKQQVEDEMS